VTDIIGEDKKRVRAICLLSGGLDSRLAVCVLREQGVQVHGVVFDSPFFNVELARSAAAQLDIPLHVVNFSADIMSLLHDPPHGFGSCMNPCIDCHALMLKRAGELMEEMSFDFLATGEVLDERPMSQNRRSLDVVAETSGYAERVLRPLSAGLLPETEPEKLNWVDRSRLLSIEGRGRRRQLELARHYGLTDIPQPAGGCRLTEPGFCRRLSDLKAHGGLDGTRSLLLLRYGRHFRLDRATKIIVGRDEHDNAFLEGNAELYDLLLKVEGYGGPTGLLPFTAHEEHIRLGAAICARYSDAPRDEAAAVRIRSARGMRRIEVMPLPPEETEKLMV
jgi:hypothetical protein